MPKKEYDWNVGDPPPYIEAHSLTKHKVLEDYIFRYLHILTQHPMSQYFKLTLVDGFAGGGVYSQRNTGDLQLGSPLQLLKTSEAAIANIPIERKKRGIKNNVKLDLQYYFVEKKKSNYKYLLHSLNQHGYEDRIDQDIFAINQAFENVADQIIQDIKSRGRGCRSIFVLDQYGYSQVNFSLIKKIMRELPHAEIVLTIMTGWLIDYLSDNPRYMKGLKTAGLYDILDVQTVLNSKEDGTEWRRIIQYQLHEIFRNETGAKFYTPFFIVTPSSKKSYWLVHLSSHVRAQDEMKNLHWLRSNDFEHYGTAGLNMLGYDTANDALLSGQMELDTGYAFDDFARDQTLSVLQEEVPRILHPHSNGIIYDTFLSQICNGTPATSNIIKQVAENMIERKELVVTGPNGVLRRKASTIHQNDVLTIPQQGYFIY